MSSFLVVVIFRVVISASGVGEAPVGTGAPEAPVSMGSADNGVGALYVIMDLLK